MNVFYEKGIFRVLLYPFLKEEEKSNNKNKTNLISISEKRKQKPTLSQGISTQSYYMFLAGTRAFVPTRHSQTIILSVEFRRRRRRRVLSDLRRRRAEFSC